MTGAISEFDRREREDSARIPVCKFVIKLFKVVSLIFFEVEAEANPGGGAKPASYSHLIILLTYILHILSRRAGLSHCLILELETLNR